MAVMIYKLTLMNFNKSLNSRLFYSSICVLLVCYTSLAGQIHPNESDVTQPKRVLFIGNSFMFGAMSPVRFYRASSITDLNGLHLGGVPALFKTLTTEAGLNFDVNIETIPGAGLDAHLKTKLNIISQPWDQVVMLGFSLLDKQHPGNPDLLIKTAKEVSSLLHDKNQLVNVRLVATWARADQIYPVKGSWHGKSVKKMTDDISNAYHLAKTNSPYINDVIEVGEAWNRAIESGLADSNPYDGIGPGQIDLWSYDNYHASAYGYYIEALMVFGDITGLDPRQLGRRETCAFELGFSPTQTLDLQKIAYDELHADNPQRVFNSFDVKYLNTTYKVDEQSARSASNVH
jgi:hypothetical protein